MDPGKMGHIILKHIQNAAVRNVFLSLNSTPLLHLSASSPFLSKCKLSDCILPFHTTDLSIIELLVAWPDQPGEEKAER